MNAFKKIGLLLLVILFGLQSVAISQSWFCFQGRVTDIESQLPIAAYPVFIETSDTNCQLVYTDDNGFYYDSVYADVSWFVYASVQVEDCFGEIHVKEFEPPGEHNVADFAICAWQNECQAFFYYEQDIDNQFLFSFFDLSQGDAINKWSWDFGDFTYSNEVNPVHEYDNPGFYDVVLIVEDTLGNCWSVYDEVVYVDYEEECNADFLVTLDTLNNTPNTYYFTDNSTGNITEWFWDFGDGCYSEEQNPVHVYGDAGKYFVCLNISGDDGMGGICWDETCTEVSTLDYFTFGGHVFIDGFPINVEENDNSNIATAYLYRRFDNQWKYMDEREFWKFGYYWFVEKPQGEYLVRVDLHEESVDFGNYAPSYYSGGTNWIYASSFDLEDNNQIEVNINLHPLDIMQSGMGSISGYLEQGVSCDEEINLKQQIVKLFDAEGKLIDYTYSNGNGGFDFASLADGSYKVQAEITGKISTLEYATINSQNPFSDGHVLVINCDAYVGVEETEMADNGFMVKNVFPTPAGEFVNISLYSVSSMGVTIELAGLMGNRISSTMHDLEPGENIITLKMSGMKTGLFIYRIKSPQGQTIASGKILHTE